MKIKNLEALQGHKTVIEFANSAGNWDELPGTGANELDRGSRPHIQVEGFEGTRSFVGPRPNATITITLPSYLPQFPIMDYVLDGFLEENRVKMRWYTPPIDIISESAAGDTAAIDNQGVVTLAGTDADRLSLLKQAAVPEGSALLIGGKDYVIVSKEDMNGDFQLTVVDAATLAAPAAAVNAAVFAVRTVKVLTGPILCDILNAGNQSMSKDTAGVGSQIVLGAIAEVPKPVVSS